MELDGEVMQGLPVALPRAPFRAILLAVDDALRLRTGQGGSAGDVAVVASDRSVRREVRRGERRRKDAHALALTRLY